MSVRMVATIPSKKAGRRLRLRRTRARIVAHDDYVYRLSAMDRLYHLTVCTWGTRCPWYAHLSRG